MSDVIFSTIHGSHLYGMNHAGSDLDICRVTTGSGNHAHHHAGPESDTMTIPWAVFLRRITEGSHQSVEALFSPYKEWNPDFLALRPMIENYRVTGGEVFAKYERTIKLFCYGDFKRRRHAIRLSYNLRDLRRDGRFDPVMNEDEIRSATLLADAFTNDDLRGRLLS